MVTTQMSAQFDFFFLSQLQPPTKGVSRIEYVNKMLFWTLATPSGQFMHETKLFSFPYRFSNNSKTSTDHVSNNSGTSPPIGKTF